MKIQWKKLRNKIPQSVVVNKRTYEILWTEGFSDPKVVGEKRVDPCQIVIKTGETDKETVHTFIHELFHAIADEYRAGVTEGQVQKLEKGTSDLIKAMEAILK